MDAGSIVLPAQLSAAWIEERDRPPEESDLITMPKPRRHARLCRVAEHDPATPFINGESRP